MTLVQVLNHLVREFSTVQNLYRTNSQCCCTNALVRPGYERLQDHYATRPALLPSLEEFQVMVERYRSRERDRQHDGLLI